jgi:ribosomal-protein-serine acetyltransferase
VRVEDTRTFINRALRDHQQGEGIHTGIWCEGALVGVIDLFKVDRANGSGEVGYWLAPSHRGRGVMTRCCAGLTDHALRVAGLNRVEIRTVVGNDDSEAIPRRLGFTLEGLLREAYWLYDGYKDVRVYGMLATEWVRPSLGK